MKLAHDLIIPAGTEFKNVGGVIRRREYFEGMFEALIAAGPDETLSVVVSGELLRDLADPTSAALEEFSHYNVFAQIGDAANTKPLEATVV